MKSVSIVLPSYNYGRFLRSALGSILAQTEKGWELIIVDDASSDGSREIIREYANTHPGRIKALYFEKNNGLAKALQAGIAAAAGEHIAFLEADDSWAADSLEKKLEAARRSGAAVVFTDVELVGEDGRWKRLMNRHLRQHTRRLPPNQPIRLPRAATTNYIPTFSATLVRADALRNLDFDVPSHSPHMLDHWLWTQLSLRHSFYFIPERLTAWRLHRQSSSFLRSNATARQFGDQKRAYVKSLLRFDPKLGSVKEAGFSDWNLAGYIESKRLSDSKLWAAPVYLKDLLWLWLVRRDARERKNL